MDCADQRRAAVQGRTLAGTATVLVRRRRRHADSGPGRHRLQRHCAIARSVACAALDSSGGSTDLPAVQRRACRCRRTDPDALHLRASAMATRRGGAGGGAHRNPAGAHPSALSLQQSQCHRQPDPHRRRQGRSRGRRPCHGLSRHIARGTQRPHAGRRTRSGRPLSRDRRPASRRATAGGARHRAEPAPLPRARAQRAAAGGERHPPWRAGAARGRRHRHQRLPRRRFSVRVGAQSETAARVGAPWRQPHRARQHPRAAAHALRQPRCAFGRRCGRLPCGGIEGEER